MGEIYLHYHDPTSPVLRLPLTLLLASNLFRDRYEKVRKLNVQLFQHHPEGRVKDLLVAVLLGSQIGKSKSRPPFQSLP